MRKPLIKRILSWLILLPSSVVLVIFSAINRHSVMINFWPFDFAPEVRLYAVILGVLTIGVLWGGSAAWLAGRPQRRRGREAKRLGESVRAELRQAKKQIQRLELEVSKAHGTSGRASLAPADLAWNLVLAFNAKEVAERLDYSSLIEAIDEGFRADITVPLRHHHVLPAVRKRDATMLLMPAWNTNFIGLKTVIVAPENGLKDLPSVQANYQLMDRETGKLLAYMDGAEVTARRTASASALASRYLSRPDAHRLTMVGTGVLAPHLISAHATQRTIEEVAIWGRDPAKAEALAEKITSSACLVRAETNLKEAVEGADIISCATLTTAPLIDGNWLVPGQHLDLVGAFTPEMREVDDTVISRAEIYIDTDDTKNSVGEIKDPLERGVIKEENILGTLADLAGGRVKCPRSSPNALTLFKSAGTALEDLTAAVLVYIRA